jgi:ribosomal protein S18 acetylase RimI-like enzyme
MQITLRPALARDFDFCKRLYFSGMASIIDELKLDLEAQEARLRESWTPVQVRIIAVDGSDAGWLQTMTLGDDMFLAQLFVDSPFQRRGVGTEVMKRLIGEASRAGQGVCLAVAKINPALRLYQRLGFSVTEEDERKLYMRRAPAGQMRPSG